MRILAIADVEEPWLLRTPDPARIADIDLIISCGDLPASYLERVVTLVNAPLAYVRGNHDTAYAEHAPEGCDAIEGSVRSCGGLNLAGLGGSIRYNERVYGFTEHEMARQAARIRLLAQASGGTDLLVTHAPVLGYGDLDDLPHRGFAAFDTLLYQLRPRYLLHGHVHLDYGRIERTHMHPSGTVIINVFGSYVLDIPDDEIVPRRGRAIFRPKPL